jgi:hypothetical protein
VTETAGAVLEERALTLIIHECSLTRPSEAVFRNLTIRRVLEPREMRQFNLSNNQTGWRASFHGGEAFLVR